MQRWIRRDNNSDDKEVHKQLGSWNIVGKDLIPLLLSYRDDPQLCFEICKWKIHVQNGRFWSVLVDFGWWQWKKWSQVGPIQWIGAFADGLGEKWAVKLESEVLEVLAIVALRIEIVCQFIEFGR